MRVAKLFFSNKVLKKKQNTNRGDKHGTKTHVKQS